MEFDKRKARQDNIWVTTKDSSSISILSTKGETPNTKLGIMKWPNQRPVSANSKPTV
jgi:hypothetical protein